METVAIYWEEKVKIYGITVKEDLALISVFPGQGSVAAIAALTTQLSAQLSYFTLATCQMEPTPQFDLLLPCSQLQETEQQLTRYFATEQTNYFTVTPNVCLLSMHGPHFQERFGIAEVAVTALQKASVPVLLNCCTGTSLQLVVTAIWCQKVRDILEQTFVTPTSI